jgi:uroporphyrin-III C-methyltransferase/precorrin-2 dehydrogenase/sirohydrochlorin ferrochelatase
LPRIVRLLQAHGAPAQRAAAIVEQATLPGQRVIAGCLGDIAARAQRAQLGPPALLIVGEIAGRAARSIDLLAATATGAANA